CAISHSPLRSFQPRTGPELSVARSKQSLDDDDISPFAIELRVPLIDADLAKSKRNQEPPARGVFNEDARKQLPKTHLLRGLHQGFERHPAGAASAVLARDVDGELGDSGVALARAVGRSWCEGDHPSGLFHHHDRMNAVEPPADVRRSAGARFEGC